MFPVKEITKHSCPRLLEDRTSVWKRWKSYVENKPHKYRIVHGFWKASHKTYLQELIRGEWVYIERLPSWYYFLGKLNLEE